MLKMVKEKNKWNAATKNERDKKTIQDKKKLIILICHCKEGAD